MRTNIADGMGLVGVTFVVLLSCGGRIAESENGGDAAGGCPCSRN
jgi:hypothetical protein